MQPYYTALTHTAVDATIGLRGMTVRKKLRDSITILPKILLCLTLSSWLLEASRSSPTADEAGAVDLSPLCHRSPPRLEGR